MFNDTFENFVNVLKTSQRPSIIGIEVNDCTNPESLMIYNDYEKCYKPVFSSLNRNISDINSLISVVKMECERRGIDDAKGMTIYISESGGIYYPDDSKTSKDSYIFTRKLSQQYETLKFVLNKEYNHKSFLNVLRQLKPSVMNFNSLYEKYLDIKFIRNFELTSSPVLTKGSGGETANLKYKVSNGNDQTIEDMSLPVGLILALPYSKNGTAYHLPVDIIISISEHDRTPVFELSTAELEAFEEKAILEEVNYLREKLSEYSKLYIHNNF